MESALHRANPIASDRTHSEKMTSGIIMFFALYCAVANAENMTAGSVMFTAKVFISRTPSRERMFFLRQITPSRSITNTGSAFSRTAIRVFMDIPPWTRLGNH